MERENSIKAEMDESNSFSMTIDCEAVSNEDGDDPGPPRGTRAFNNIITSYHRKV